MASTYSTNLALELIGTGDQAGTWGVTTNTNLGTLLEQAISGYVTQAVSTGTDTTITIPNGSTGVARNMYIELTGTGGTNTNLIVPANKKLYFIFNNASGAVTVKVSGQTGVSVPTGKKMILVSNGTDIVNGVNYIADFGTNSFTVTNLTATSATITNLIATTATVSDLSATVLRAASATITNLIATSASITTLTNNPTFSAGTANGVLYLNGSKVATSGSALTFDGTNLGVGTASPGAYRLNVQGGSSSFTYNAANQYAGEFYNNSATGYGLYVQGGGAAARAALNVLDYAGTSILYAGNGNNVGIGTSSPSYKLDVQSATATFRLQSTTGTNAAYLWATNSGGDFYFGRDNSTGTTFGTNSAYSAILYSSNAYPMAFFTNATERMRINSSGNVGIGTASPASKLHVSNTAAATRITITDDVASGRSGYIESNYSDALVIGTTSGVRGIRFSPDNTPRMFLDTLGNLGIGTSSPSTIGVSGYTRLVLGAGSSSTDGLTIVPSGTGGIQFTDAAATKKGYMQWDASTGALAFGTAGTTKATLDSSGNLGLGVTPSAWGLGKAFEVGNAGNCVWGVQASDLRLGANMRYDGTNYKYINTNFAARYDVNSGGTGGHSWHTAASGTAGNTITFTQAMTLDASGRLGIGTTSPVYPLVISASGAQGLEFDTTGVASAPFIQAYNRSSAAYIQLTYSALQHVWQTSGTERARITSGGYFKASNDGSYANSAAAYHELRTNASDYSTVTSNNNASPYGAYLWFSNADPNNTTNLFLLCNGWNGSANATRATIRSNGGLANYQSNNVDLSDARTKKDIAPAASMWGKIGALEVVTYKYNDQTHDDVNVGVIAQQVESVEPVWVDSDGFGETPEGEEPLKTVYTKDITFAAIKALQEAMARIEQLEAKVAALESA